MKNNENKDIIVIIGMVLLMLLIIVPPILRIMVPKQEETTVEAPNTKTDTLICTKNIVSEKTRVEATITYTNNQINSNQIIYTIDDQLQESSSITGTLPSQEMAFFKGLNNINAIENENSLTVILDNNTLNNNSDNETLKNYLQEITLQQQYYETDGYECKKQAD